MPGAGYSCLTLLTDYGFGGGFVGVLHAVAFGIAPAVPVIDLDHSVPAQDVRRGAHRLERLMAHVPPGVHVAVVDPGVGTDRRPVAIETPGRVFVGPDNGLLVPAARRAAPILAARVLTDERYWSSHRDRTFDGRDVFVPVAAHLAAGVPLDALGPAIDPDTLLAPPARVVRGFDGRVELEVVDVDRFGNVQLAAGPEAAPGLVRGGPVRVGERTVTYGSTFSDVAPGELLLYVDSDGLLSLAVNGGRASDTTGLDAGDLVVLSPPV